MGNNSCFLYEHLFLKKSISKNISAFISGNNGAGCTWCALSIAHAINLLKQRVLLVDANGAFSNISSYLQLSQELFLEDFVKGKKTLNQLLIAYKNKDFNILTGKSGNIFLHQLPQGRINIFIDDFNFLAEGYNCSIVDIGLCDNDKNLSITRNADNIIIVCSEDTSDVIKTFDLIKTINELDISANYYLIINKVNSYEDGYKVYEKINKATERNGLRCPELLGIIRFDARVRDTIKNKELLLNRYPTSEAASDIVNIANKLYGDMNND